ncbi:aspartyl/asparaginyl beta-hydroxylase domain-containing protein [Lysobacter cavernae]|uniref:Aspartyl/asparaginyl beta-hydroxylase domain-containing protein n=1 Tax=Lysobacter cavernae TaxID=1685901 RepID=A0ABV7RQQ9_9GAMM
MPSDHPEHSPSLDALVARARTAQSGSATNAGWQQVLDIAPHHPEALYQLGWAALSGGNLPDAESYLQRAAAAAPNASIIHATLARVLKLRGHAEQAIAALDRAIATDPMAWGARFEKGEVLDSLGRKRAAAMAWAGALSTIPDAHAKLPEVQDLMTRALAAVRADRSQLGDHLRGRVDDLRTQADTSERRRFDHCLAMLEGRRSAVWPRPQTLAYPGLPAIPFFERDEFDWVPRIEEAFADTLHELRGVLTQDAPGFEPYVQTNAGEPANQFAALDHNLDWGAYFLWKHGHRIDAHCRQCPKTEAMLAAAPQVMIPDRAPVAFFSALKPRTHIPPHHGATNTRLTVHLPLIVPEHCALRVGDETRGWEPGKLLIFDDTFEHEAWNRSDALRVVLIFDVWHPMLSPLERELVTQLVQGMLDFYRNDADLGEL